MRRRDVLKWGGGGLLLAMSGGLVWRANSQNIFAPASGSAYKLWEIWDAPEHVGTPLGVVFAGMLAANPHNTQPWLFEVNGDSRIIRISLLADQKRNLGAFDPYLREMYTGFGCAVENMVIAAQAYGFESVLEPASGTLKSGVKHEGTPRAAELLLIARPENGHSGGDFLYDAIGTRHTNRGPYHPTRSVPDTIRRRWERTANENQLTRLHLFTHGEARTRFDAITVEATEEILKDREMLEASHHWFRDSYSAIQRYGDGVTLDSAGLSSFTAMAGKILPPLSIDQSHRIWLTSTREVHLPTAPVTGIISVANRYGKEDARAAGRLWQNLHLQAQHASLALHPLNQPCEMIDRAHALGRSGGHVEEVMRDLTGGREAVFSFRAGYPVRPSYPSPRRNWEKIVSGDEGKKA